jgi:hypothetical protein
MMLNLLRSLLLSTLFSFTAPVALLGTILLTLYLASYIPWVGFIGQVGSNQMLQFLSIFGSGYPAQGLVIIGIAFAVVGSLFDLFNFYVYQGNRSN